VELPENKQVKSIFCGNFHTFVVSEDNILYSCGQNDNGQLGLSDNQNRNTFQKVTIPNNEEIKQVIISDETTFILTTNNSLYACGENDKGQLGLSDNQNRNTFQKVTIPDNEEIKQIVTSKENSFILTKNNNLYACGENRLGQLGLG